jgi:hypothetical protein
MKIVDVKILSARKWNNYFPLQVVYEWESVISNELQLPIDDEVMMKMMMQGNNSFYKNFQKIIRNTYMSDFLDSSFNYLKRNYPGSHFLSFFLYPLPTKNHYMYSNNIIPILLDCFSDVIDNVPIYFKKSKLLFVTNYEVYERLMNTSLKGRLVYLPLSVSDKYFNMAFPTKDIDVLQMGRQNEVLHSWMLKITATHPEVEYVYSKLKDGELHYYSTQKDWMGPVETRTDFMSFLSRAKISLLSSPGIDGGEVRTGGFNPVTPRFFESAVNYCYMAGRYPITGADFKYCNVAKVCQHYDNFDQFSDYILTMLKTPFDQVEKYNFFIKQHLTSVRAGVIKQALLNL